MKSTLNVSALLALASASTSLAAPPVVAVASAVAVASSSQDPDSISQIEPPVIQISLTALNSGNSDIDNKPINACLGKFWVNLDKPCTSCPSVTPDCSAFQTTKTVINIAQFLGISMEVAAPGGQDAYIAADGSLMYNQAHDHSIPANATYSGGAACNAGTAGGGAFDVGFTYQNATGPGDMGRAYLPVGYTWLACPAAAGAPSNWQVFAKTPTFALEGCVSFKAGSTVETNGTAYQFD